MFALYVADPGWILGTHMIPQTLPGMTPEHITGVIPEYRTQSIIRCGPQNQKNKDFNTFVESGKENKHQEVMFLYSQRTQMPHILYPNQIFIIRYIF